MLSAVKNVLYMQKISLSICYLVCIVHHVLVTQGLLTRQKTGRSCTKLSDSLLKKLLLYWRLMKSKSLTDLHDFTYV